MSQRIRKLLPAEVVSLIGEYQADATVYELAAAFKINRKTVSLHLHRAGVTMRQQGLASAQIAQAVALYEAGWPLVRLGKRFSVDHGTVHNTLRKAGVPMRKPWERVS